MKILHTYCLNYNIGDYALAIGLKNLLRKYCKIDLIADANIQGREFHEFYINEVVNKRFDLLVIGGGGIIHGAHWPNGWFWLIEKELIKKIKIPFIVYGAGNNYWDSELPLEQKTIDHLNETKKRSAFFSVRNDGSAQMLFNDTGIQATVTPDPGFHVNLNSYYKRIIKSPYVIVQLANDKPMHRFVNEGRKLRFILEMKEITKELAKKYKVVFAPHVFDDLSLCNEVSNDIANTMIWDFGSFAFDHVERAIGFYKYADFVIAMRGHGQIVPIAFNTPVISLENHPKHRGLMEELYLLEYNVNLAEKSFLVNLKQAVEKIQVNKSQLIRKYASINQNLMEQTNQNFIHILNSI